MHLGRRCLSRPAKDGRRTVLTLRHRIAQAAPSSPVAGPSRCRCFSAASSFQQADEASRALTNVDEGFPEEWQTKPPKGLLAGIRKLKPSMDPDELNRIRASRILRAERAEQIDIYRQLSDSSAKTYMGGFTVPKQFKTMNRLEWDPWADETQWRRSWSVVKPPDDAYRPHSVIIFATRYPVAHQIGEASHVDFKSDFCPREQVKEWVEWWNGKEIMGRTPDGRWDTMHVRRDAQEKYESAVWPDEAARPRRRRPKLAEWEGSSDADVEGPQEAFDAELDPGSSFPYAPGDELPTRSPPWARRSDHDAQMPTSRLEQAAENTVTGSPSDLPDSSALTAVLDPRPDSLKLPLTRPHLRVPGPPFLSQPFFIPILRIDLPTRPLAEVVAQLSTALERGLPFHGAVPPPDRKDGASYSRRLLAMRVERMQRLIVDLMARLEGERGGLVGLRSRADQRGWGVQGESWDELPIFDEPVKVVWLKEEEGGIARDSVLQGDFRDAVQRFGDKVDMGEMDQWGEDLDAQGNVVPWISKPFQEGKYGSAIRRDGSVKVAFYPRPSEQRKTLPPAEVVTNRRKLYIEDGDVRHHLTPSAAAQLQNVAKSVVDLEAGYRPPEGWKSPTVPERQSFYVYKGGSISVRWDDSPLGKGDADVNQYVPLPKLPGDDMLVTAVDVRETVRELNQARLAELRRLRFTGGIWKLPPRKPLRQVIDENIAGTIAPGTKSWWELRTSLARFGVDIYDIQRLAGWEFSLAQPAEFVGKPDEQTPQRRLPATFGEEAGSDKAPSLSAEDREKYDALSRRARMQGSRVDDRLLKASAIDLHSATDGEAFVLPRPPSRLPGAGPRLKWSSWSAFTDIATRAQSLEEEYGRPVEERDVDLGSWEQRMREMAKDPGDRSFEKRSLSEGRDPRAVGTGALGEGPASDTIGDEVTIRRPLRPIRRTRAMQGT